MIPRTHTKKPRLDVFSAGTGSQPNLRRGFQVNEKAVPQVRGMVSLRIGTQEHPLIATHLYTRMFLGPHTCAPTHI